VLREGIGARHVVIRFRCLVRGERNASGLRRLVSRKSCRRSERRQFSTELLLLFLRELGRVLLLLFFCAQSAGGTGNGSASFSERFGDVCSFPLAVFDLVAVLQSTFAPVSWCSGEGRKENSAPQRKALRKSKEPRENWQRRGTCER
jgi:hypothetical protein